jgi:hypothetical protein
MTLCSKLQTVDSRLDFNSRTDLSADGACMPPGATDPCKVGVVGSTPIRSTLGSWSNGTIPLWRGGDPSSILGGSTDKRKVTELAQETGY